MQLRLDIDCHSDTQMVQRVMTANTHTMPSLFQYCTGCRLLHPCPSIWKRIMVSLGFVEGNVYVYGLLLDF